MRPSVSPLRAVSAPVKAQRLLLAVIGSLPAAGKVVLVGDVQLGEPRVRFLFQG